MIVVLGRPEAAAFPGTRDSDLHSVRPAGLAVEIACAAAAAGGQVELVGSIGDDPAGDAVVVGLGRAGVGHAALLRDPACPTPRAGDRARGPRDPHAPRLDRADVDLGLGYLVDYGVLVLAEPLAPEVESAALDAAAFHSAQVVALVAPGTAVSDRLARAATVLEGPRETSDAFARAVGRFAAELDAGTEPGEALATAVRAAGWAPSA